MKEAPLIITPGELTQLAAHLAKEPSVALDTEASGFHHYHERIGLIQLSDREQTWLVDPLVLKDMSPLGRVLQSAKSESVIHDAGFDLRLLKRAYGFRIPRVFDTLVAAQLVNEPGLGLAALLHKYFGVEQDKRFQKADWCKRPLTPAMLAYASGDTRHLLALRDVLAEKLVALGRWDWALEEFDLQTGIPFQEEARKEPAFLRIKGAKRLKPQELAVLKEVVEWREGVASRLDRASFMIVGNETLLNLARQPVSNLKALAAVKGMGRTTLKRYGRDILAAVERGVRMPKDQWPRLEKPKRFPRDPAFDERFDRLKEVRNTLAQQYELRSGLVTPNHVLKEIARIKPASIQELMAIGDVRKYQAEVFGPELLRAI